MRSSIVSYTSTHKAVIMLRTFNNRFTRNVSQKRIGSCERHFSSPPIPKYAVKEGKGGGIVSLLTITALVGGSIAYIKTKEIRLDPQIENVIGTLLGTEAVLFLRPKEVLESESMKDEESSSYSLYKPVEIESEFTVNQADDSSAVVDFTVIQTDDSKSSQTPTEEVQSEEAPVADLVNTDTLPNCEAVSIPTEEIIEEEQSKVVEIISPKIEECPMSSLKGKGCPGTSSL